MIIKKKKEKDETVNRVSKTLNEVPSLNDEQLELISRVEALEVEKQELLEDLVKGLKGNTFAHPNKGLLTVMPSRNGQYFLRPKPTGRKSLNKSAA